MSRTVPLSIIRSLSLYTQQWYCHTVLLTACEQIRMELVSSVLILLASCQKTCLTYTIAVCTVKNP